MGYIKLPVFREITYLIRGKSVKKRLISLFVAVSLCLTGCADWSEYFIKEEHQNQTENSTTEQSVQNEVIYSIIEKELPKSTVKVMVDQNGYEYDAEKSAAFVGDNIGSTFRLINKNTRQVVYEGELELINDEKNIYLGDFSEIEECGEYFIEADRIGRSYSFSILEDTYQKVFENVINIEIDPEIEKKPENIIDIAIGMHILQLALKCHGKSFENIQNGDFVTRVMSIAELLKSCQDKKTGSICDNYEATAAFCAVMSLCAVNFGKYDANVSRTYSMAAEEAWKWLDIQGKINNTVSPEAGFYAASSMYYNKGLEIYKRVAEEYLINNAQTLTGDIFAFLGVINYLDNPNKTDRDICNKIMGNLVKESEEICVQNKQNSLEIYSNSFYESMLKILLICFVDYVTPSEEYASVQENMMHYLMGRNEQGKRFISDDFRWDESEITKNWDFIRDSILIYMLSDLVAVK